MVHVERRERLSLRSSLTSRRVEFLEVFRRLMAQGQGNSPKLKELADELHVKQSTIRYFIRRMTAKGYISSRKGKFRTLRSL
jgi:DNA-binding MarR family transcriptional regulator